MQLCRNNKAIEFFFVATCSNKGNSNHFVIPATMYEVAHLVAATAVTTQKLKQPLQ